MARGGSARFRVGHDVAALGGMRLDGLPGAIPPHMFRMLQNVRFTPSGLTERGGQHKLNSDPLEGCVTGFIPGDAAPIEFEETLYTISEDTSPSADPGTAELFPWDPTNGVGAAIGGADHIANVHSAIGAGLHGSEESILISTRNGGSFGSDLDFNAAVIGDAPPTDGGTFGGGANGGCCGGIALFGDAWYNATVNTDFGTTTCRVHLLDPLVVMDREVADATADNTTRVWLAVYEEADQLLAPLETNALHRKSASGAWSRVALPAGCTVNRNHLANWAEFAGLFYFTGYGPGGGHLLYRYDGATITAFHSWVGSPGTYSPLRVHEGALYFAMNAGGTIQLGRYDGATVETVSTFSGTDEVRDLVSAYGRLFAFRGDTLESSLSPESAAFTVDDSTSGLWQAGALRRTR